MEHLFSPLQLAINKSLHQINECKLEKMKTFPEACSPGTAGVAASKSANQALRFDHLGKSLQFKLRRVGLRGELRSVEEAARLYDKIPSGCRTSVKDIEAFLVDKHASHIVPYSVDQTKSADNIKWENGIDNQKRGPKLMTINEQRRIDASNSMQGNIAGLKRCVANGSAAFTAGFMVEGGKAFLDKSLSIANKKDIFVTDTAKEIVKSGAIGGVSAAVVAAGVTAACFVVPPIGTMLTALSPLLAVLGTGKVAYDFGSILNKHFGYRRAKLHVQDNIFYLFSSFVPAPLKKEEVKVEDYRLEVSCNNGKALVFILAVVEIFASAKSLTGSEDIAFDYIGSEEFHEVYSSVIDTCSSFDTVLVIKEFWDMHKLYVQKNGASDGYIVSQQLPTSRMLKF